MQIATHAYLLKLKALKVVYSTKYEVKMYPKVVAMVSELNVFCISFHNKQSSTFPGI